MHLPRIREMWQANVASVGSVQAGKANLFPNAFLELLLLHFPLVVVAVVIKP